MKRIIPFMILLAFIFSGCSQSKQIDKVVLAEAVTVSQENNQTVYTFCIIAGENRPNHYKIPASNLSDAVKLAKSSYVPNISLSKLDLYAVQPEILDLHLKNDVDFIASQAYFSPLISVVTCDNGTIKKLADEKDYIEEVKKHIVLIENNNSNVKSNCLSVFNSFSKNNKNGFDIPYINSNSEIKRETTKIISKK